MNEPWIAFEGLGIRIEGIEKGFNIGNFTIYWYGILIAAGFLLAIILGLRTCEKFGFSQDDILTYIIVATPVAVIGARLYFVVFKWDYYSEHLSEVFSIRDGGLAIYGAVIGILIAAAITAKIKKQSLVKLFDFGLPYVLIGQAVGRWGNFVNQEAYGRETTLPWGMSGSEIENGTVKVHPDFLYESLWCILVFAFIMLYKRKLRKNDGELMCLYFVGYGIGRAFIESIRGDDALLIGNQRVSMWLSVFLVIGFGALFVYLRFFKKTPKISDSEKNTDEIPDITDTMDTAESSEVLATGDEPEKSISGENTVDDGEGNVK